MATAHPRRLAPSSLLAAGLLAASSASAMAPSRDRLHRRIPKETVIAGAELGGLLGWSPMPTEAPMGPPAADLELRRRYDKGSDTCGFADGYKSDPWTCYAVGATCSIWSNHIGCCATTGVCSSTMITACYNWADVQAGSCSGADSHTLCCTDSLPSCWAWISTTSTEPDVTATAFNCMAAGGTGILWEAPPGLTSGPDTSTTTITTTTDETSTQTNPVSSTAPDGATDGSGGGGGGGSSTNIGAIVGGVIGGLAVVALALLVAGLTLWRRRNRRDAPNNASSSPNVNSAAATVPGQQPMMQNGHNSMMPPPTDPQASYYPGPQHQQYYDPSKTSPGPGSYTPAPGPHTPSPSMYPQTMAGGPTPPPQTYWQQQQTPPPPSPPHWGAPQANNHYGGHHGAPPQEMAGNPVEMHLGSTNNRAELS